MIKKVLIANRGEIAVRIIRACREMGIETVAVYSEADKEALHAKLADEAVCIGPASSSESYLSMDRIISATIITGADAIHPGFGFLSENSKFAELCEQCNITFIGPPSQVIARLGNKQEARNTMTAAHVPVIPGTKEAVYEDKEAAVLAEKIGYPVIVKPANLGSSVGIGRAGDRETLYDKIADAARYSRRIIVEHMIDDLQEINCSVLGDCDEYQTSVLEEPVKSGEILSYTDKYMGGTKGSKGMQAAQKRIPADLPEDMTAHIRNLAGETFRVLSCHGVSRVDLIADKSTGEVFVNEINTIPGSLSFYLWEATGLSFSGLMNRLVALALKRRRQEDEKTVSYDQNIFNLSGGVKGVKGAKTK